MLEHKVKPDWEALVRNLRREGTPERVHYIELFLDVEIQNAIVERFSIAEGLDRADAHFEDRLQIRLQRFLCYDYVTVSAEGIDFPAQYHETEDTTEAEGQKRAARSWLDEHRGPISSWDDFEKYPWPSPAGIRTEKIEWYSRNLPDDMCIVSRCHHILEQPTWLMGYENLALGIYDQPDLVDAVFTRCGQFYVELAKVLTQFERIPILFGGDDLGFKTQTLLSPSFLREKVIPWHKKLSGIAHESGKLYLLHSCGNLEAIMDDLIDAGVDGRHSFEDAIEPVTAAKERWGSRIALLGGIDVGFLCRADESAIRRRVRETLSVCMPGGGYCLGTGNSVANYIPVNSYLAMLDEGRRYT